MEVRIYEQLMGKTLKSVTGQVGGDEIVMQTEEGRSYRFYHLQDCCESVTVEDICGDLNDLVGSPLIVAEESTKTNENPVGVAAPEYQHSFTWTFYRFATAKGFVTIRWYGSSNGCYSESVDFAEIEPQPKD